jgi:hypothetical protein
MRKFLSILGALTLIVIVAAGIGLGVLFYKGHALDTESRAFVDSAVPAIAATWSTQQLLDRGTPELRQGVKLAELNVFFGRLLAQLGPLVEYEGATGQANVHFAGSGSTVSGSYVAKARFENGTATFRITLMKRDGRWMIHYFHVDSAQAIRLDNAHDACLAARSLRVRQIFEMP